MAEFRDDSTKNWMRSFKNYEENGFGAMTWADYLEAMIDTDPIVVKIRMEAPKAFLIGNQTLLNDLKTRNDPTGSRIRIELSQKIRTMKTESFLLF
jgi:hypothetical protein